MQYPLEIDAAEKERVRKVLANINAQRRPLSVPYKRARLWQFAVLCFLAVLFGYWWLAGALRSIGW